MSEDIFKKLDLWIEESKKVGTKAYYELQAMQKKLKIVKLERKGMLNT